MALRGMIIIGDGGDLISMEVFCEALHWVARWEGFMEMNMKYFDDNGC